MPNRHTAVSCRERGKVTLTQKCCQNGSVDGVMHQGFPLVVLT